MPAVPTTDPARWYYTAAAQQTPARPWAPCSRFYSGNMCGVYVPGLPPVPGGARNPNLVLSWFLDRYSPEHQACIKADWKSKGLLDVLVSWPDSRAMGATPESFAAFCEGLYAEGFEPAIMLLSKNFDAGLSLAAMKARTLPVIQALTKRVGRWCIGWELDLWLSPQDVADLRDWMAPLITPWGGRLYVHFSTDVASWQPDGNPFAVFWNASIGKLTGLFWQADGDWTIQYTQDRAADILERFSGKFFCSPDSGFGHPFDCVVLEQMATHAFNDNFPESIQNLYARGAVNTPTSYGPLGPVRVMGSGNGVA